jgi:hypothetical protein
MKKRLDADSSFCRSSNLSEIARLITGTRWSGPAFFGLKAKQSNVSGNLAGERLAPDCALRHQVLTAEKFRRPFPRNGLEITSGDPTAVQAGFQ